MVKLVEYLTYNMKINIIMDMKISQNMHPILTITARKEDIIWIFAVNLVARFIIVDFCDVKKQSLGENLVAAADE